MVINGYYIFQDLFRNSGQTSIFELVLMELIILFTIILIYIYTIIDFF